MTSPSAYNNGQWHLVVAEIGPSGQQLWVDGVKVASNPSVTSAQNYTGYWHLGWGYETGWANAPANAYLTGSLAEAVVVPAQLSAASISLSERRRGHRGFDARHFSAWAERLLAAPGLGLECLRDRRGHRPTNGGHHEHLHLPGWEPAPARARARAIFSPGSPRARSRHQPRAPQWRSRSQWRKTPRLGHQ